MNIIHDVTELLTSIKSLGKQLAKADTETHRHLVSCLVCVQLHNNVTPLRTVLGMLPKLYMINAVKLWCSTFAPIAISVSKTREVRIKLNPNRVDANWKIEQATECAPWDIIVSSEETEAKTLEAIVKMCTTAVRKSIENSKFDIKAVDGLSAKIRQALTVNPPKSKTVAAAQVTAAAKDMGLDPAQATEIRENLSHLDIPMQQHVQQQAQQAQELAAALN